MNEEVSIKLQGGLGNYMFQITSAYVYALKHNKKAIFSTDDAFVGHNHLESYKNNILSKIDFVKSKNFNGFNVYSEPQFNYNEIPNINGSVYLNGYFQTEKYFKEHTKEIRDLFSFSEEYKNLIKEKYKDLLIGNTCSIHVRRGDYLKLPNHHPVQSLNYLMKGVREMPEDTRFLIFSDDINWCKQNFPEVPEKFIFIEGNPDYEDLLLMSLCKNNIIANSSFSWWAAWLNENVDKKVIAPSKWFGTANITNNTKDLIPETWKII
jgi:hypothetical protein